MFIMTRVKEVPTSWNNENAIKDRFDMNIEKFEIKQGNNRTQTNSSKKATINVCDKELSEESLLRLNDLFCVDRKLLSLNKETNDSFYETILHKFKSENQRANKKKTSLKRSIPNKHCSSVLPTINKLRLNDVGRKEPTSLKVTNLESITKQKSSSLNKLPEVSLDFKESMAVFNDVSLYSIKDSLQANKDKNAVISNSLIFSGDISPLYVNLFNQKTFSSKHSLILSSKNMDYNQVNAKDSDKNRRLDALRIEENVTNVYISAQTPKKLKIPRNPFSRFCCF